jgi:hypothetical protein
MLPSQAVAAPLDVHRAAVVLFDQAGRARKLEHFGVRERETIAIGRRHVFGAHRLARRRFAANTIFCSLLPSRRRRMAGLPAASIGLCT